MKFDVIVIGGGPAGVSVAEKLQAAGLGCALINSGRSIHDVSYGAFRKLGGIQLSGDTVCGAGMKGAEVEYVTTTNLPSENLYADYFVLATGKFFGKGIVADMDKVYEPVFGLDVQYSENRGEWFCDDFSAHQPFLDFGVKADEEFHPAIAGVKVPNLFVCGEVMQGVSCSEEDNVDALVADAAKVSQLIIEKSHAGE